MTYIHPVSYRITDAGAIEARLLELAHTTEAKITAPALAYFAPCSLDDAGRVLDDLAARDRLSMEIEDDGTIVYHMPGRQKLAAPSSMAPLMAPLRPALVPAARFSHGPNPALAGLLSALIPGAGHLYAERPVAAILWFVIVGLGYTLLLPGLILHLFSIASAASSARRLEAARARPLLPSFIAR
jgi:hypothetical protein